MVSMPHASRLTRTDLRGKKSYRTSESPQGALHRRRIDQYLSPVSLDLPCVSVGDVVPF